MLTLSNVEIKAIAKLLKTSDDVTANLLKEQLKTFDDRLLVEINNEISSSDIELKESFLNLALGIKRDRLKNEFLEWGKDKSSTLEKGVFLIASFVNPLLDIDYCSGLLDKWASLLDNSLKGIKLTQDPTSVINEINHFMFMELGLKGNRENYYDPQNSFIDKVLEKKTGNPILLSVVYLLVTNRLGLLFSGVNMPAHFLIQYADELDPIYIDPFNQGEIITRVVCQERVKMLKLPWQEDYLLTPSNKQIVIRMMQNLINIYTHEDKPKLKEYLESYVSVLRKG